MEILFNEHNENLEKSLRDDSRINETQRLLDEYQRKVFIDSMMKKTRITITTTNFFF